MKKIFILSFVFLFAFTLTACTEDTTIQDSIDDLTVDVADLNSDSALLDAAIDDLETELAALEDSVTDLETNDADVDALIADILADITAIEAELAALDTLIGANDDAIAALDVLIAGLQGQVTVLEGLVDEILTEELPFLKQVEIILVHTNDVHGRVNADSWAGSMGMATIKNIMDEIDAQFENALLVDAGDILHGTTFATLEEGESVLNVMNFVGYDLMVPGNHDFNYGQEQLLALELLADFDIISANIQYDADDTDMFNPYVIQEFDGVKVGFFGLTSPETVYKTHPDNVIGLNFLNPIDQAAAMVEELEPLVDVIVLLAHVGIDADTSITTEDIALAVDGIDVIIDGHSHSTLEHGMMVNDTLIVSTGEYMKNLGVLSIVVQGGQVIARNAMLIDADYAADLGYGDDAEVQAYIDEIVTAQDIILNEVIGQTAVDLMGERNYVRTGETNLGNLITDSMIDITGADVSFTNGGGIRASIPTGDVTVGDVITVLPFGNIIVTKEVTGQQLLDILEHGTSSYPSASGKFPHVGGMTYEINLDNAAGFRVENLLIDGVPVVLGDTYLLATNDFLAAGGDGYDMLKDIPTAAEFGGLHDALMTKFVVGTDVILPTMGRIVVTYSAELFFSEYAEADGGSCKYVEIYNPSEVTIDLTDYQIIKGGNGTLFSASGDIYDMVGTIEAHAVLVLGNTACTDSGDEAQDAAISNPLFPTTGIDWLVVNVAGYVNGDDALGLFKNGVLIDTIGLNGEDPGSSWAVGNGDLLGGFTANVIMVRVPTAYNGDADWAVGAMEWIVQVDDRDYSTVGVHEWTTPLATPED